MVLLPWCPPCLPPQARAPRAPLTRSVPPAPACPSPHLPGTWKAPEQTALVLLPRPAQPRVSESAVWGYGGAWAYLPGERACPGYPHCLVSNGAELCVLGAPWGLLLCPMNPGGGRGSVSETGDPLPVPGG